SLTTEVLFSRPSVREAGSIIGIRVGGGSHAAQPTWRFLRDAAIFDGIAGENEESETNWRRRDVTDRLHAVRVTDNYFDLTGIPVALGRPLATGERDTAVISHNLWQRRFGGDQSVVGARMLLDGQAYTV